MRARPSLLLPLLLLSGCFADSAREVIGDYQLRTQGGVISLRLLANESLVEKICWQSGRESKRLGQWSFKDGSLSLYNLWIPPEFAPDFILQADATAEPGHQAKYTEPGNWVVSPVWNWFRLRLSIFPDADIEFTKTGRLQQCRLD